MIPDPARILPTAEVEPRVVDDPAAADVAPQQVSIQVFTTGGTIDKEYSIAGELEIGLPMVQHLLTQARTDLLISVETLCRKDSLDMDAADRADIRDHVDRSGSRHIIITRGTDSMVETAQHLVGVPDKVVVLTGAMQPARMLDSDAAFNIGLAVAAVQTLPDGIYIAMSGRVFRAGEVRKDTVRGRFVSA